MEGQEEDRNTGITGQLIGTEIKRERQESDDLQEEFLNKVIYNI
jgi:hypothetical protein